VTVGEDFGKKNNGRVLMRRNNILEPQQTSHRRHTKVHHIHSLPE
jgi:hypothetical protein